MRNCAIIFYLLIIFCGCKKEPLEGDFQNLVGSWECEYTTFGSGVDFVQKEGFGHTLTFEKNGIYKINNKQDGGKDETGRITKLEHGGLYNLVEFKNYFQKNKYLSGEYKWSIGKSQGVEILFFRDGYAGWKKKNLNIYYQRKI